MSVFRIFLFRLGSRTLCQQFCSFEVSFSALKSHSEVVRSRFHRLHDTANSKTSLQNERSENVWKPNSNTLTTCHSNRSLLLHAYSKPQARIITFWPQTFVLFFLRGIFLRSCEGNERARARVERESQNHFGLFISYSLQLMFCISCLNIFKTN